MQPSKLPYIFGVLLIVCGPLLLVTQVIQSNRDNFNYRLTNAVVIQKEKEKDSVMLKVRLYEVVADSTPVGDSEKADRETRSSAERETLDTLENSHYAFANATERKKTAELNGDDNPGNNIVTQLRIDPKLVDKYSVGDTIELRYNKNDHSKVKLKQDNTSQKKNAGSWLAIDGSLFILGIVLVIRYKRRLRESRQAEDVLSSLTTYSSIKKNDDQPGAGKPGPF